MQAVSSEAVARYQSVVEHWATPYVGWNEAELDDLIQEGLIAVWLTIADGGHPSKQVITGRMIDYVRVLGRQLGRGKGETFVPILPLLDGEDLDNIAYDGWFADEFTE